MNRYAIIGFGCAGYHAAEAIREIDKSSVIDVYSDHSEPPYNPMLTTYLAGGKISRDAMFPFGSLEGIKKKLDLNVFTDSPVKSLDVSGKKLVLFNGAEKKYDKILISSGARAFAPPIKGLTDASI